MDYVKSIKNKLLNNSPEVDNNNDNFSKIDSNKYFNLNKVSKFFYLKRNGEDKILSHNFQNEHNYKKFIQK